MKEVVTYVGILVLGLSIGSLIYKTTAYNPMPSASNLCTFYWQSHPTEIYDVNEDYICKENLRAVGTFRKTKSDYLYITYVQGNSFGEFLTKESARKQVETICALKKIEP